MNAKAAIRAVDVSIERFLKQTKQRMAIYSFEDLRKTTYAAMIALCRKQMQPLLPQLAPKLELYRQTNVTNYLEAPNFNFLSWHPERGARRIEHPFQETSLYIPLDGRLMELRLLGSADYIFISYKPISGKRGKKDESAFSIVSCAMYRYDDKDNEANFSINMYGAPTRNYSQLCGRFFANSDTAYPDAARDEVRSSQELWNLVEAFMVEMHRGLIALHTIA